MLSPNPSLLAPNPYPTLDPSLIAALTQCQLDYVTHNNYIIIYRRSS